jgi:hypothetical protein
VTTFVYFPSTLNAMADAVENAKVILVGVSEGYKLSEKYENVFPPSPPSV